MAYAIDAVVSPLPIDEVAPSVELVLNDIAPGTQTSRFGSLVLVLVLDQMAESILAELPLSDHLQAPIRTLRGLHLRASVGEKVLPTEWRAARASAVQATDLVSEPRLVALCACLEAGAWDPVAAPVTVGEVLRLWIGHHAQALASAFGWTTNDHSQVQRLLDEMHRVHIADHPEETRDVFQLLAIHHPAVEARLRAFGLAGQEANAQAGRKGLRLLREALSSESSDRVAAGALQ